MKIFSFLMLFSLLLLSFVSAVNISSVVSLNLSNSSFALQNLTVTSLENQTMFIEKIGGDSRIITTFPSNVYFDSTNKLNVTFNVSTNSIFLTPTFLTVDFNLSNDFNSNVNYFSLIVNVTPKSTISYSEDSFIDVVNGDSTLNISETLLPRNGSFTWVVNGPASDTLLVDCGVSDWISCHGNLTFNSSDAVSFDVLWDIPRTASVGDYDFPITLRTSNLSVNRSVKIFITKPALLFDEYILSEACFYDVNNTKYVDFDCYLSYEQHNIKRLSEVYELWRDKAKSCEERVVNQTVMVGSVDGELYLLLDDCKSSRDGYKADMQQYQSDFMDCQDNFNEVSRKYDVVSEELNNNKSETLTDAFNFKNAVLSECADNINQTKYEAKKKVRRFTWFNISIWILTFVVIYLYFLYKSYLVNRRFNFR